ncbi:hypothetical protein D3C71_1442690 [compost metagenome]
MALMDSVKTIAVSLVLSAIMVAGSAVIQGEKQEVVLKQNVEAVKDLTAAVIQLKIDSAVNRERFVTWEQLRAELQKGRPNGS